MGWRSRFYECAHEMSAIKRDLELLKIDVQTLKNMFYVIDGISRTTKQCVLPIAKNQLESELIIFHAEHKDIKEVSWYNDKLKEMITNSLYMELKRIGETYCDDFDITLYNKYKLDDPNSLNVADYYCTISTSDSQIAQELSEIKEEIKKTNKKNRKRK